MSEQTKVKLRRCPFCNSHDVFIASETGIKFVQCAECGAQGPVAVTPKRVAEIWNDGLWVNSLINGKSTNRNDEKEIEV